MNPILAAVLGVLVPFVAAFLATELAKVTAFVQALPTPFPQLIAVVVAFGLAALAQLVGFALPGDLGGVNQDVIAAILTALVHMLFPVTAALKASRVRAGLRH